MGSSSSSGGGRSDHSASKPVSINAVHRFSLGTPSERRLSSCDVIGEGGGTVGMLKRGLLGGDGSGLGFCIASC